MTSLDPQQHSIGRLLFSLSAAEGFALAGGSALLALGVIRRPTRDVDAFVGAEPGAHPGDVRPLAHALEEALTALGWTVAVVRSHETFTRMVAEGDDGPTGIDLAVDMPTLFPTEVVDGLPVLSSRDLVGRKVLATVDRAEGRDFTDLAALVARFDRESCIGWARQLDPGLTRTAIADAFGKLGRLVDSELPVASPDDVRDLFAEWGGELRRP